jgi:hypothetical protein
MIRLTFSQDRGELEALGSKLSRAGILSEVRTNPLTTLLGINRFELFVHETDLATASDVCQGFAPVRLEPDASPGPRGARGFNGAGGSAQSELLIEAKVIPPSGPETFRDDAQGRTSGPRETGPESDLAQATALLEEEVEALLGRESKLLERSASLEERAKAAEQALDQARADLVREKTDRSEAERKLAEACDARAALEKVTHTLESRLKMAEQAMAAAQAQLDLQTQQQEQLAKERREQQEEVQAYVGTVNELRNRVRARLAAKEGQPSAPSERRARRSSAEN